MSEVSVDAVTVHRRIWFMEDDVSLTKAFADVGARYGYKEVKAKFAAFRDFKIKWMRSYRWAEFTVSDYLMGASEDVMMQLSDTLYRKMRGECECPYPPEVTGWMTSEGFIRRNQPLYLSRYRSTSLGTGGGSQDLSDSLERLMDLGIVEDDPWLKLRWALNSHTNSTAKSSVLMKTVIVSDRLDRPDVPRNVLDYVVYAHVGRIQLGYNPDNITNSQEYSEMLERFPGYREAEEGLRRMDMQL